ncbi:MAG: hypothetical protein Q8P24_04890 [Desulfobacterales bacterium]|nr:hypothetical protein [Desulfobacterales bacterium]
MKKVIGGLIAIVMVLGLIQITATASHAEEASPKVVIGTPVVQMSKTSKVIILGSGFKPGQEVRLLFTTDDGLQSDIGYALNPEPKANENGVWATTWEAGRYVGQKLVKQGAYVITATDADYKIIDQAPVSFAQSGGDDAAKKKKKK